jgi:hypothetical protein
MALDPVKVRQAAEKADSLTKRMDGFLARRAKRDADKVQKKADRDFETRRDADAPQTPEVLNIDPDTLPQHPWFDSELLASERRELRTGALSKDGI